MCLGLPMQVIEVHASGEALCAYRGALHVIDTRLVPDIAAGDWVMTFLGSAREKMDEASAQSSLSALAALEAIMSGGPVDIDAAFPDLVNREPQLPEHLRPAPAILEETDK